MNPMDDLSQLKDDDFIRAGSRLHTGGLPSMQDRVAWWDDLRRRLLEPRVLKFEIVKVEAPTEHNLAILLLPDGKAAIHLDHRFCWKQTAIRSAEEIIESLGMTPKRS